MSKSEKQFYPACGVCARFQGNKSEEPLPCMKCQMEIIEAFAELDKLPKNMTFGDTADVHGNDYGGLTRQECMDKLVASIEAYGLWYELDVIGNGCGNAYEFYFAPRVSFHFTGDEWRDFFARISNAIEKYQRRRGIMPSEPKSSLWELKIDNKSDETPRL